MHLLAERFVFWGWWLEFSERRSQGLSNGTNFASWHRQLFSVFTSIVYALNWCRLSHFWSRFFMTFDIIHFCFIYSIFSFFARECNRILCRGRWWTSRSWTSSRPGGTGRGACWTFETWASSRSSISPTPICRLGRTSTCGDGRWRYTAATLSPKTTTGWNTELARVPWCRMTDISRFIFPFQVRYPVFFYFYDYTFYDVCWFLNVQRTFRGSGRPSYSKQLAFCPITWLLKRTNWIVIGSQGKRAQEMKSQTTDVKAEKK